MYGTQRHDRFHQLAEKLVNAFPDSRVVLVDWSQASTPKTSWLGIPNPHPVASRINPVAAQAASELKQLGIQARKVTLIGESFGNWVNAEIARHLGKVDRIVAMNPASELGGYSPPDLRPLATTSWSFHTYSVFDTLLPIGHMNILLESVDGTSDLGKHTAGIRRLTGCLRAGDKSWLTVADHDGGTNRRRFNARATVEGQLVRCDLPMQRPSEQKLEPQPCQTPLLPPLQSIATAGP
jgi:pimeloyl-ACP methyl ester carboxylesterase